MWVGGWVDQAEEPSLPPPPPPPGNAQPGPDRGGYGEDPPPSHRLPYVRNMTISCDGRPGRSLLLVAVTVLFSAGLASVQMEASPKHSAASVRIMVQGTLGSAWGGRGSELAEDSRSWWSECENCGMAVATDSSCSEWLCQPVQPPPPRTPPPPPHHHEDKIHRQGLGLTTPREGPAPPSRWRGVPFPPHKRHFSGQETDSLIPSPWANPWHRKNLFLTLTQVGFTFFFAHTVWDSHTPSPLPCPLLHIPTT